ncbi:TniQ family protein [Undibacterium terreum]|uniref:TniQ family protein n=1 Tax=Undibacterium terreum TaxID=1224302 RepID=UPI0016656700|nr:TniQ family protein [Undibacterium terreum]
MKLRESALNLGILTFWLSEQQGEALYSLCARFHHRSGFQRAETSSKFLFGFARASELTGIPKGLSHLASTVDGIGPPMRVLREMTVAGAYLPFMHPSRADQLLELSSAQPDQDLLRQFGVGTSCISGVHDIKICPQCEAEDINQIGFPYWRAAHQFPGVYFCESHRALLNIVKNCHFSRHRWNRAIDCENHRESLSLTLEESSFLRRVTKLVLESSQQQCINTDELRRRTIKLFFERQILAASNTLDRLALFNWWKKVFPQCMESHLEIFRGFASAHWVNELLSGKRKDHPLRWACLLAALFQDSELEGVYENGALKKLGLIQAE